MQQMELRNEELKKDNETAAELAHAKARVTAIFKEKYTKKLLAIQRDVQALRNSYLVWTSDVKKYQEVQ